jgi:hypothetical protein
MSKSKKKKENENGGSASVEIRRVEISSLVPAEYNPRRITEEARAGLATSISSFGYVEPIIWNERTGRVVGGHQRLEVLRNRGITEVDVVVVNIAEDREKALNVTLNNSRIQGEWDFEKLDVVLAGIEDFPEFNDLLFPSIPISSVDFEDKSHRESNPKALEESFRIIVECESEAEQLSVLARLQGEGLKCQPWIF